RALDRRRDDAARGHADDGDRRQRHRACAGRGGQRDASGVDGVRAQALQSIVVAALRNQKPIIRWLVNKTVFLRQPPRPPAGQLPPRRFGLAGPGERRARAFLDEAIQAREQFGIVRLPIEIVLPSALAENKPHSATARSVPPPRSSSPIASSSLSAFLALRMRWCVSS